MKVGVIGMGSIGSRHAFNLKRLGHDVLPHDSDGKHLELKKVLDEADAFVIATPIGAHYHHINACAAKPTFVEKPITDQIGNGLITTNVKMVGYNLRFHSCVLKAKEWINAGHLGEISWANFVCSQKNRKYTEHVILNWSHEIDLALYLLGPAQVKNCAACGTLADLTLRHIHVSGTEGSLLQSTIHLDYVTEPWVRQAIIVGDKASLIMDLERRYAWLRNTSGTIMDQHVGQDDWDDNYVDEMETFIARCEGQETAGATAEDGLAVTTICLDAINRSRSNDKES